MKAKLFLTAILITSLCGLLKAQNTFEVTIGDRNDTSYQGNSVQQTKDGGYIVAGTTLNYPAPDEDVFLTKTDSFGKALWTKIYGGANDDEGNAVQQTGDGGYIIAGNAPQFINFVEYDGIDLIKTDSSGTPLWSDGFYDADIVINASVQQASDGDILSLVDLF